MCWHRYFRYIENRYDTLAEMYQITIWKMYVSGSLNSLSTRHLHQVVPASCLWVPVTPGRTPAWTEHGDQPGVAGYSSICLRQFRFLHQLSTWTTASSSHHLMASASRTRFKKSVLMFKHFDPDRHFVDGIHLNKAGYTVLRRRLLRQ